MIAILGYYGFDNLGDEAILAALCADLVHLGVEKSDLRVLSGNPGQTTQQHGVPAVYRYDFAEIWRILGQARCLITGGGSLLQDVTSRRSIPYYLGVTELALGRGVPVVVYGQGVGPVQSRLYRRWVKRVLGRAAAISVRDLASLQFLTKLGLPESSIQLAADPVFQLESSEDYQPNGSRILLNIRPYALWPQQKPLWLGMLDQFQQAGLNVEFLPLGPGDLQIGRELKAAWPALRVHPTLTLGNYDATFTGARLFISMRLHGVILSAIHRVLPLAVNYDPKVSAISLQLGTPCFDLHQLANLAEDVLQLAGGRLAYNVDYAAALERLRRAALVNRAMLKEVLKQVNS